MEPLFKTYFEQRYREEELRAASYGPVITISREFGCPSKLISMMLVEALNKVKQDKKSPPWQFINKEIVEEAARKLEINPVNLNSLLNSGDKGLVKDILKSFSPPYVNDHRIRKILFDVIRSFAHQGNMVIVGRGSVAILKNRPKTLHVRLMAPLDWRIKVYAEKRGITVEESSKMVIEMDKKRSALIELLFDRKPDHTIFDLLLNCSTLSIEEVVNSIVCLMQAKKFI